MRSITYLYNGHVMTRFAGATGSVLSDLITLNMSWSGLFVWRAGCHAKQVELCPPIFGEPVDQDCGG
jgi:low affinity Fe/Cu permease